MELTNPMTGLELAAVLPSLRTDRGQRYHDLVLQWKSAFGRIDVPLDIVTDDAGAALLQDPEVLYMQDAGMIVRLGSWQEKTVFGHKSPSIQASLCLVKDGQILERAGRINEASLLRMWKKAFAFQTKAAGILMAENCPGQSF